MTQESEQSKPQMLSTLLLSFPDAQNEISHAAQMRNRNYILYGSLDEPYAILQN